MIGLILLSIVGLYLFYLLYWRRRDFPPGPLPLPIVGNLLEIGKEAPGTQAIEKWRQEYGRVFTYWLGNTPFVALCDYESIKEVLSTNGDVCTDREFFDDFYRMIRGNSDGIFNLNGATWREHSNFIHKSFRQTGVGQSDFEEKVLGELEWLFNEVNKDLAVNKDFAENLSQNIDVFVGSTVNLWLLGYTFSGDKSEQFLAIKRCVVEFMSYSGELLPTLVRCCPQLNFLPFFREATQQIRKRIFAMHHYFEDQVEGLKNKNLNFDDNEQAFGENSYVRNFLLEIKAREGKDKFNAEILTGILRDMWIAGQDTVTNTIEWGLIYMIYNQDKQAKLHEEFDRVINSNRMIKDEDAKNLPYLKATISEIQRLANIVPFNIPRKLTSDLTVDGYHLKKGTPISACISSLFYDEKVFPDPLKFCPERFLDQNGKYKPIEKFIPFSVGRRMCLGKNLADIELYLFFSNFLNHFKVLPSTKHSLPSLRRNFGISVKADKFYCQLTPRF